MNEIRSLSELPMDKLIHIKSSLTNNNNNGKSKSKQFIRIIIKALFEDNICFYFISR